MARPASAAAVLMSSASMCLAEVRFCVCVFSVDRRLFEVSHLIVFCVPVHRSISTERYSVDLLGRLDRADASEFLFFLPGGG